jgi:hypothetical protein
MLSIHTGIGALAEYRVSKLEINYLSAGKCSVAFMTVGTPLERVLVRRATRG